VLFWLKLRHSNEKATIICKPWPPWSVA